MSVAMSQVGRPLPASQGLLAPFQQRLARFPASPLYLLGLLTVACTMILLPLMYVGFVGLVGYGVYYHASHHVHILHGTGFRVRLLAYFGPLIIGVILFVFLIKPLFSRPARRERRISLVRDNEPLLFDFVEALCRSLGAPAPRRIDVDLDVNAAAAFRRGWLSLLGRDMVLFIGLPLVAGLTVRQFAGIMAHEFGHFSQALAMRLSYIVSSVNGWFARVVYERDTWDQSLAEFAESEEGWTAIIAMLARFFVGISRGILWVLMMLGHAISCMLSRQMEFNADRRQIVVAGSDIFEPTFLKIHLLSFCQGRAFESLEEMYRERRLPDSLPAYIASMAASAPAALVDAIGEGLRTSKQGLFDTHPPPSQRIVHAERRAEPGAFREDAPASILFRDFEMLCREATRFAYQGAIGSLESVRLVPTASAATTAVSGAGSAAQPSNASPSAVVDRYFQATWDPARCIPLPASSIRTPLDAGESLNQLRAMRSKLEPAMVQARPYTQRLAKARKLLRKARAAQILLEAKLTIDPKVFYLSEATIEAATSMQAKARAEIVKCEARLKPLDVVQGKRLLTALGLLGTEAADRVAGAADLLADGDRILAGLAPLQEVIPAINELDELNYAAEALAKAAGQDVFPEQGRGLVRGIHERLTRIRSALSSTPYPFDYDHRGITLAGYLIRDVPDAHDVAQTLATGRITVEQFRNLYARLMTELVSAAEQMESAAGLRPLSMPDMSTTH